MPCVPLQHLPQSSFTFLDDDWNYSLDLWRFNYHSLKLREQSLWKFLRSLALLSLSSSRVFYVRICATPQFGDLGFYRFLHSFHYAQYTVCRC
jgi:hypothetical protein